VSRGEDGSGAIGVTHDLEVDRWASKRSETQIPILSNGVPEPFTKIGYIES
jgi:hypothetical protein